MKKSVVLGIAAGAVAVAAAGGGAAYVAGRQDPDAEAAAAAAAAEAEKRLRFEREEEPHAATVFSFLPQTGGGARPVMVHLRLAGSNGLRALCAERPRAEEALLRVFADVGVRAPVVEALNGVLPGRPVRGARVVPLRSRVAGGRAAAATDRACHAALKG